MAKTMMINCLQLGWSNPILLGSPSSSSFFCNSFQAHNRYPSGIIIQFNCFRNTKKLDKKKTSFLVKGLPIPVDPWSPTIDSQSIAPQLFAFSLFPYIGFLYFITKSNSAPKLTLFGFYFLLAFVGATIPAGIYAKVQYGTSLSNVDWLHGGAESLLTLTNLFIVIGLRKALREAKETKERAQDAVAEVQDEKTPSV